MSPEIDSTLKLTRRFNELNKISHGNVKILSEDEVFEAVESGCNIDLFNSYGMKQYVNKSIFHNQINLNICDFQAWVLSLEPHLI